MFKSQNAGDAHSYYQVESVDGDDIQHHMSTRKTPEAVAMMWRLLLQRAAAVSGISDATLNRWIKTASDYGVAGERTAGTFLFELQRFYALL